MEELLDKTLLKTISSKLKQNKETLSVAESVTAGMLQCSIAAAPDAMQFFQGGITAYNVAQKYKHLHVEPIHAVSVNAVSEQVAIEMAQHVCKMFCSNWGIGITGYATPVPESDNKLYAFYAIVKDVELIESGKLSSTVQLPLDVQRNYIRTILKNLSALLK